MTELKTLKDIDRCLDCDVKEDNERCVDYEDLRQEAIKWIKQKRKDFLNEFPIVPRELHKRVGEDFIKFFNLTEEDLK